MSDTQSSLPRIGVVIPAFRAPEALARCLQALEASQQVHCELFVRDNSDDNVLWTAAVNEGLLRFAHRPDIEAVLVLNQDAIVTPDTLITLLRYQQANWNCGIVCPLQLSPQDADYVTWGGSMAAFPAGQHLHGPRSQFKTAQQTYWANGAALLLRARMITEIGLFDRNMRFIAADADYSFTARARNWQVHVVPEASVVHSPGASGAVTDNAWLERIKLQDALYFAGKWLGSELYRRLSAEGARLTAQGVQQDLAAMRQRLAQLQDA